MDDFLDNVKGVFSVVVGLPYIILMAILVFLSYVLYKVTGNEDFLYKGPDV